MASAVLTAHRSSTAPRLPDRRAARAICERGFEFFTALRSEGHQSAIWILLPANRSTSPMTSEET